MRIVIAELKQESNTFAAVPTTLAHFEDFHLWYGDDVIANARDTNTELGGFIDVCEANDVTMLPTLAGFAISGAPLTLETIDTLRADLLRRISAARPFDGVLLALHGAMVADGDDDPDGSTIKAVRDLIGPDVPLAISMDLHANITRRCIDEADILVGFKTCPHIDQRETGRRTADILVRTLRGEITPRMAYVKIPMVTPASTHIHFMDGPFKRLQDATMTAEENPILAASAFTVQPWLDISEMGFAIVAVSDADIHAAQEIAADLAQLAWDERENFLDIDLVAPEVAIERALAAAEGPIVLSDCADGTGAGSPGDSTALLAALLDADLTGPAYIWCFDPETAAKAAAVGVGGAIDVMVGGKLDSVYNQPVRFQGTVTYAQPASFRFGGEGYTGVTMNMGQSAVLRAGHVHLLVSSKSVMTVDPALYRTVGLEPADAQIVVVKSHIQFRAGYKDVAKDIIMLDTPGMSSDHLESLGFARVHRPLFPLDPDLSFTPGVYPEDTRR